MCSGKRSLRWRSLKNTLMTNIPPSCLLRGEVPAFVFRALVATDIEGDNIRVVTMYLPNSGQWDEGGRFRRAVK